MESPVLGLRLMGAICSASPSNRRKEWNKAIDNILFRLPEESSARSNDPEEETKRNLRKYFFTYRQLFSDKDFLYRLTTAISRLILAMDRQAERPSGKAVYVSVAGLFSAAKSSLLNFLVGYRELLPVSVTPSTVVPAFLYCGPKGSPITVAGVNNTDALVTLDTDVLNCISHSTDGSRGTAAQIATSLQHFIVQVPAPKFHDIVFIDTPGYGNAQTGNKDSLVADRYMQMGEAVLWLTTVKDGGVIKDEEMAIIRDLAVTSGGKPRKVVVVITKVDLVGEKSQQTVFDSICAQLAGEETAHVADVVAVSTKSPEDWVKYYRSRSGCSLEAVLRNVTADIQPLYETQICIQEIKNIFGNELREAGKKLKSYEEEQTRIARESNEAVLEFNRTRNRQRQFLDDHSSLSNVVANLIRSQYEKETESILKKYNGLQERSGKIEKQILSLEDHKERLAFWDHKLNTWFKEVMPELEKLGKKEPEGKRGVRRVLFDASGMTSGTPHIHYWNSGGRQTRWPGKPMARIPARDGRTLWIYPVPGWADGITFSNGSSAWQSVDFSGAEIVDLYIYNRKSCRGAARTDSDKDEKIELKAVPPPDYGAIPDIFTAIEKRNMDMLFRSLTVRNDITGRFNPEGMSAVTFAAACGNCAALRLFVKECGSGILDIADKRGLNALHSAAKAMNFETCREILGMNPDIADNVTLDGLFPTELFPEKYKPIYDRMTLWQTSSNNTTGF